MKQQILLYYKYVQVPEPETVAQWQRDICLKLDLKGRIIIAAEGINGTISGKPQAVRSYMKDLKAHKLFKDIEFKISFADEPVFPRLSVKVRSEIVTLARPKDMRKTAKHLTPKEWHIKAQEEDVVIIDARNKYESAIGKFKGAITPDIQTFKELPDEFEKLKTKLKGKKILTYCTGGVRCEPFTAYLKEQGYEDVYQLKGGIIKYGEKYPEGLFEGKCFVFDNRMSVAFKDKAEVLGTCIHCQSKTDEYYNCALPECNKLVLVCNACQSKSSYCAKNCEQKSYSIASS